VKGLLHVFLCLLGFAATARLVRGLVPWPAEYGPRAKLEHLAAHSRDYDTLFIGSSVTYYGVVCQEFDRVMAAAGRPSRSFNLGVGGMSNIEADYMLRRALEMLPQGQLRTVFVELTGWDPVLYYPGFPPRLTWYHDWPHTRIAIEALERTPAPAHEVAEEWRRGMIERHLELFAYRTLNYGMGPRTAHALTGINDEVLLPDEAALVRDHGYGDLDVIEGKEWENRKARFAATIDDYWARVAQIPLVNAAVPPLEAHPHLTAVRAQIEAIRARGAEVVYFTGPRAAGAPHARALRAAGELPAAQFYDDPERYPELYAVEGHFDPNHLTRAGATLFTRQLALDHAASLAALGPGEDE